MSSIEDKKLVMWDGKLLYLRRDGSDITLGKINTRKGGLTRAQKLKAVQFKGEWIEI